MLWSWIKKHVYFLKQSRWNKVQELKIQLSLLDVMVWRCWLHSHMDTIILPRVTSSKFSDGYLLARATISCLCAQYFKFRRDFGYLQNCQFENWTCRNSKGTLAIFKIVSLKISRTKVVEHSFFSFLLFFYSNSKGTLAVFKIVGLKISCTKAVEHSFFLFLFLFI